MNKKFAIILCAEDEEGKFIAEDMLTLFKTVDDEILDEALKEAMTRFKNKILKEVEKE